MVTYKNVHGFEGYRVGDDGSVWSCRYRGKVTDKWFQMKIRQSNPKEYLRIPLYVDRVPKSFLVHRLIKMVFDGPPDGKLDVAHNDGNRHNNCLSNLRYATRKENNMDKIAHGTSPRGNKCKFAKLSEADVIQIRTMHKACVRQCKLSKMFVVNHRHISDIINRKRWAWLAEEVQG